MATGRDLEAIILPRLAAIAARDRVGVSAGDLARALGLPPAAVRDALAGLVRRGRVERDVVWRNSRLVTVWSPRSASRAAPHEPAAE